MAFAFCYLSSFHSTETDILCSAHEICMIFGSTRAMKQPRSREHINTLMEGSGCWASIHDIRTTQLTNSSLLRMIDQ